MCAHAVVIISKLIGLQVLCKWLGPLTIFKGGISLQVDYVAYPKEGS